MSTTTAPTRSEYAECCWTTFTGSDPAAMHRDYHNLQHARGRRAERIEAPQEALSIAAADGIAAEVTAALNTLAVDGTHDQDVAPLAGEGHYFWEAPTSHGVVFACLAIMDGDAGFTVDVRGHDEPLTRYGMVAIDAAGITAAVIAAHIARAVALAEHGKRIA